MTNYILVTDGSISDRGVCDGGFGFRFSKIDENGKKELIFQGGGFSESVTNNRMEMMAIKEGAEKVFQYFREHPFNTNDNLIIISDSDLCVRTLTEYIFRWIKNLIKSGNPDGTLIGSAKKPVLNQDIIKEAFKFIMTLKRMLKVHIFHIKSHLALKNRRLDMEYFVNRNNCSITIELFNSIVEENELVDKLAYNYMKNKGE